MFRNGGSNFSVLRPFPLGAQQLLKGSEIIFLEAAENVLECLQLHVFQLLPVLNLIVSLHMGRVLWVPFGSTVIGSEADR